jgi:hypothetical protein
MRFLSLLLVGALLAPYTCAVPAKAPNVPLSIPPAPREPAQAKNDGAGKWGSKKNGRNWATRRVDDYKLLTYRGLAELADGVGLDNAARHFKQYFKNSKEELRLDVDKLLDTYPAFQKRVRAKAEGQTQWYWEQMKKAGKKKGQMTFSIDWEGDEPPKGSEFDWWLALGKYYWCITGVVYKNGNDPKTARSEYRVHVFDRYNWDGTLGFEIAGRKFGDAVLARFHLIGKAREYNVRGSSSVKKWPYLVSI